MTEDEGRALSVALHDVAERGPGAPAPIDRLVSRGRRRRRARSATSCAVGVTGAAVLAAFVSAGPGAGRSPDTASGTPAATSPSPIALSLAAARTDANPFHFTVTATSPAPGGKAGGQTGAKARTEVSEGAFDPSTMRGYTKAFGGGQTAQSIRIGDTCYSQPTLTAPWLVSTCSSTAGVSLASLTQDPAATLKQLETAGQATYVGRTGSGSGELDTWKFTFTRKTQVTATSSTLGYTVTGTASVGAADGQVSAIDYTVTIAPDSIVVGSDEQISIKFSEYGAPVSVSAPVAATKE
ncbi:hypothetical protein KDL01_23565 [Actinospica durhamensis]|uniref:Lipoprotein n=1 Tax=Actinospica durhamensis TaxID=1508375 RepID=A0A941IV07_9ACTN|nr:hypothetical protein [Actinospica durhamensis]MBR7836276.1 hypothetical protein [Actinospica durhamensis]